MSKMLTQEQVLERLCALSTGIRDEVLGLSVASDCFCLGKVKPEDFRFEEDVIKFIESAVKEYTEKVQDAESELETYSKFPDMFIE